MFGQRTTAVLLQLFVLAGVCLSNVLAGARRHSLHKRHILQMCELIAFHTNRGCLDYNNYGCFCGLGNAASHHVDAVDGCCRIHDQCYGNVYCFWIYPQFVGYNVDCTSTPSTTQSTSGTTPQPAADTCRCTDSPLSSPCAYTTCQCDLQFAQCLARARYNQGFSNYDRSSCSRRRQSRRRRPRRDTAKSQWRDYLLLKKRFS